MSKDDVEVVSMDSPLDDLDQEVETKKPVAQDKEQTPEPKIPEKFKGKSVEDIIQMYENAEKEKSRIGNELGENRKLVDKLLQAELSRTTPVKDTAEEPDWDYEPDKAAKKLVDKEVGDLKKELQAIKQKDALKEFKSKYPDYEKDASDPQFMEWVQGSKYRADLYMKNYNGVDIDAASELLDLWNERKSYANIQKENDSDKRQEQLKAASLEKGASTGGSRKKMWSRTYIRHIRMYDKPKYEANKADILAAYDEGRVTK